MGWFFPVTSTFPRRRRGGCLVRQRGGRGVVLGDRGGWRQRKRGRSNGESSGPSPNRYLLSY
jgi:hypothetical protein